MKVIAFGASTSKSSINKSLAGYVASLFSDAEVTLLDLNNYDCPLFSEDLEREIGQAKGALAFIEVISQADVIIVSFAEHNGNYTSAFKNLFDWCTRIQRKIFNDKPMLLLSTSPGERGAATVLEIATSSIPRFGGDVIDSISVPNFHKNFDIDAQQITNQQVLAQIKQSVKKIESLISG
jgi:chromate reductase, NAD(P)H dehydrogenase (quinone)